MKVFQFPPPSHLQSDLNLPHVLPPTPNPMHDSNPVLTTIKQEEWSVPCLQDNMHNMGNLGLHHDAGHETSDDGLQHLSFPSVATSSSTLQQPDQGSPMAISPASLNTPRGSITSFRSRSQQNSPMNMDSAMTTCTSLVPTSAALINVSSAMCATSCVTTTVSSSLAQMDMLSDVNACFTIQVPHSSNSTEMTQTCSSLNITANNNSGTQNVSVHGDHNVSVHGDCTMLSSFPGNEGFDEGGNTSQYVSYTMLQPSSLMVPTSRITNQNHLEQEQHQLQQKFPSPPRSGYSSPVHNTMAYPQNYQQGLNLHNNPPPSYEDFMSSHMAMSLVNETGLISNTLGQHVASANPADVLNSTEIQNFFNEGGIKTEPDMDIPLIQNIGNESAKFKAATGVSATGSIPDHDSLFTSDTCPETPDSSIKEETDVNSPDTGSYICLWLDCNEEFDNPKTYVDHVNEAHMETRKGCEEFPCLWKVIELSIVYLVLMEELKMGKIVKAINLYWVYL